MEDNIRMDSHKLIFHPERVSDWLSGKNIYPIGAEIAPSGTCNHRCVFCALDYMEYKPILLDKDVILANLKEMAVKGLKSVVFAGEGEPLINKNTPEIIAKTKSFGVDAAMSTNGVLLTREAAEECLGSLTWIRFSVSGATKETYNKIHRGRPDDLNIMFNNLRGAVELKKEKRLKTTIGVQLLLIPENSKEVFELAKLLKEVGVDYFTVKPFSQHPKSVCSVDEGFDYREYLELEQRLEELNTDSYRVIFRANAMKKKKQCKGYDKCFGLPFFTYIDAGGGVWPCIAFLGEKELCYGNLNEQSFTSIWEGEQRAKVMKIFETKDISKCRELCRLDEINKYLHELKNPGGHVNFI